MGMDVVDRSAGAEILCDFGNWENICKWHNQQWIIKSIFLSYTMGEGMGWEQVWMPVEMLQSRSYVFSSFEKCLK